MSVGQAAAPSNLNLVMFAQVSKYAYRENVSPHYSSGSAFCSVEKGEGCGTRPHGSGLHPAFGGTAYTLTMADILGSFNIKRLLYITLFLLHKRPDIFIVLT